MDEQLKKLHEILYSDNYESDIEDNWFIEEINNINNQFNLNFPISNDSVKLIVEEIYNNDNVDLLSYVILGKYGFDWDENACEYEFERGDWFDDNEEHEYYEEQYGEEGTDYYSMETKNKKVIYSKLRHFDLPYELCQVENK
jgi:hypothetical protein